jgi:hypothetical protein
LFCGAGAGTWGLTHARQGSTTELHTQPSGATFGRRH